MRERCGKRNTPRTRMSRDFVSRKDAMGTQAVQPAADGPIRWQPAAQRGQGVACPCVAEPARILKES